MQIEPDHQTVPKCAELHSRQVFMREYVAVGHHELLNYDFHRSRKTCTISIPGIALIFEQPKLLALLVTGPYANPSIQNVVAVDVRDILVIAHASKRIYEVLTVWPRGRRFLFPDRGQRGRL